MDGSVTTRLVARLFVNLCVKIAICRISNLNAIFGRTASVSVSAIIVFSPSCATFPAAASLHKFRSECWQNANAHLTVYICTDPCSETAHGYCPSVFADTCMAMQRSPLTVGQKVGVTYHLKIPCRNVTEIAPAHFFLVQRLAFMFPVG